MSQILADLKAFVDSSPTSWHAVQQLGNRFAMQEFIPLNIGQKWTLEPGKKYFVSSGGSLCAFSLPKGKPTKALLFASHTDSPALKIKPRPTFYKKNMALFGVEVYGSPLIHSWLNRDLAIAGRVVLSTAKGEKEEHLVWIDEAPLVIPQLAIHLDREVNEKGLQLNKQEHLCPIVGLQESTDNPLTCLENLLRRHLSFHTLLAFDLFLVPLESSRFIGSESEFFASYRIDNLLSVHAAASALAGCTGSSNDVLRMAIFWDHEEIGSRTREGAASPFLGDILKRISLSLKISEEEFLLLKNQSLCASIDMAHALNPNYLNKHDPNHEPLLGKGVVLKYNADQRYASDALSASVIVDVCQKANLPLQTFVSRSDIPCGSTVGPLIAHIEGIPTVDLGCPQLSMHSIREVCACQDYLTLCQLLAALL